MWPRGGPWASTQASARMLGSATVRDRQPGPRGKLLMRHIVCEGLTGHCSSRRLALAHSCIRGTSPHGYGPRQVLTDGIQTQLASPPSVVHKSESQSFAGPLSTVPEILTRQLPDSCISPPGSGGSAHVCRKKSRPTGASARADHTPPRPVAGGEVCPATSGPPRPPRRG